MARAALRPRDRPPGRRLPGPAPTGGPVGVGPAHRASPERPPLGSTPTPLRRATPACRDQKGRRPADRPSAGRASRTGTGCKPHAAPLDPRVAGFEPGRGSLGPWNARFGPGSRGAAPRRLGLARLGLRSRTGDLASGRRSAAHGIRQARGHDRFLGRRVGVAGDSGIPARGLRPRAVVVPPPPHRPPRQPQAGHRSRDPTTSDRGPLAIQPGLRTGPGPTRRRPAATARHPGLADHVGPGQLGSRRGASPPRTASIPSNQPEARRGRETSPPIHAAPASQRTPAIAGRRRLRPSIDSAGGIGPTSDAGRVPDGIGRARRPSNPATRTPSNAEDRLAWAFRATSRARRLRRVAAGVPGRVERRCRVADGGIKTISPGVAPASPITPGSPT
jgi:hypothetical protein